MHFKSFVGKKDKSKLGNSGRDEMRKPSWKI